MNENVYLENCEMYFFIENKKNCHYLPFPVHFFQFEELFSFYFKRICELFAKATYAEADVAACCVASKSILLVNKNKIEMIHQK